MHCSPPSWRYAKSCSAAKICIMSSSRAFFEHCYLGTLRLRPYSLVDRWIAADVTVNLKPSVALEAWGRSISDSRIEVVTSSRADSLLIILRQVIAGSQVQSWWRRMLETGRKQEMPSTPQFPENDAQNFCKYENTTPRVSEVPLSLY